ncbi:MAG: RiPP maturation radical SAM C-methyltransferase [Proteobacteria bacterium]|nr:RiPP maturation radical SAM C-methyltransferase [Pseudomonadota bacterium]MBU1710386.1 RiPP maturation radical SAM C-methyltransferase [Pseudomonadota bacterium]
MTRPRRDQFRIALIAMPWHLFNRPSLQLGTLKAYIEKECPWVEVTVFHPYLEVAAAIGTSLYQKISLDVWASEALYGSILFPDQFDTNKKLFDQTFNTDKKSKSIDFRGLRRILERQLEDFIQNNDWSGFHLAGFSVCFSQLLSSLSATEKLKEVCPDLPIVFGGSTCVPHVSESLLRVFPQVDYVISGEGEKPLVNLCGHLSGRDRELIPQVLCRDKVSKVSLDIIVGSGQLKDLSSLPVPDYTGYFKEMAVCFAHEPFIPELPVEFSRGCWWGKCSFCNLNLEWRGYRSKKPEQMLQEVEILADRFNCLDFCFADNALPVLDAVVFFKETGKSQQDFRFFAEVRVNQCGENLAFMKNGGLAVVQVGIEALSDGLLKKLTKGATVIENIAVMRDALSLGIELEGNLIVEFPGSTEDEVDETLKNLDYVLPFRPLSTAAFFLGHGSPVACDPEKYGIRAIVHHWKNRAIFPAHVLSNLKLLIDDYHGDRVKQRARWSPVVKKVLAWRKFHQERQSSMLEKPMLSYRDGGSFLIIRQEIPGQSVLHHRLKGVSRKIYLFCMEISDIDAMEAHFGIDRMKLSAFLGDLVDKKLMFTDGKRFLALAVRKGK